jgi:hypothetical protein
VVLNWYSWIKKKLERFAFWHRKLSVQISWFLTPLYHFSIKGIEKYFATYDVFVKMKLVSTVVHINTTMLTWLYTVWYHQRRRKRECWGCQRTPGVWGFRKGTKPDFCLSEFSHFSKHPWIWKAIYGADYVIKCLIISILPWAQVTKFSLQFPVLSLIKCHSMWIPRSMGNMTFWHTDSITLLLLRHFLNGTKKIKYVPNFSHQKTRN